MCVVRLPEMTERLPMPGSTLVNDPNPLPKMGLFLMSAKESASRLSRPVDRLSKSMGLRAVVESSPDVGLREGGGVEARLDALSDNCRAVSRILSSAAIRAAEYVADSRPTTIRTAALARTGLRNQATPTRITARYGSASWGPLALLPVSRNTAAANPIASSQDSPRPGAATNAAAITNKSRTSRPAKLRTP